MDRINLSTNPVNPVQSVSSFSAAPDVNYRRLKAGGIPLHRIPIEKT
jgi:hypothetical protein